MGRNDIIGEFWVGGRWYSGVGLGDGLMIAGQNAADRFERGVFWAFPEDAEELSVEVELVFPSISDVSVGVMLQLFLYGEESEIRGRVWGREGGLFPPFSLSGMRNGGVRGVASEEEGGCSLHPLLDRWRVEG